jgi:alpha-tubulin N-acetyltransferase 1
LGIGRRLFDFVLQMEHVRPELIAVDNPSVAFLGFLAKAYGLDKPVWQNTNYVVFQQLFDLGQGDSKFCFFGFFYVF